MAETIPIETDDGTAEAFLAGRPGDPGVLFFMDAIGLRPQIALMVDRIAAWGYVVLAPNVFYRSGTAAELAPKVDLREEGAREAFFSGGVMERVRDYGPARSDPDAEAWLSTLQAHAGTGSVATTGYCMGARLSVRAARLFPGVVAGTGGFHGGGLVTDADDSPHRSIAASTAEFVFGHADHDRGMTPEHVATLEETLLATGRPYLNEVYPDAPHGYTMADTSMYQEAGAERHYAELAGLLARSLG